MPGNSYQFGTFDEANKRLAQDLLAFGSKVYTPRTGEFLELRNIMYTVKNPNARLLSNPLMGQSRIWAYCEVLSEFLGLNPPLTEQFGNEGTKAFMVSFHRGDGRANYTYGERWHVNATFQKLLKRLEEDTYSRQAIMTIWDSSMDLNSGETNVPCTIMHHFLVREDENGDTRLNMNVYLRSNDFFKGWKYDIFLNSFIHEAFAGCLNLNLGELTFIVGSFHAYAADYERLGAINDYYDGEYQHARVALPPVLPIRLSFNELYRNLWTVHKIATVPPYNLYVPPPKSVYNELSPYFAQWARDFVSKNKRPR